MRSLIIYLLLALVSCHSAPRTFADTLRDTNADTALERCINRIDTLLMYHPEQAPEEIQQMCRMFIARGFEAMATRIACYPYGINPDERPDIAGRLLTSALLPGTKAPEIAMGETSIQPGEGNSYTLIFFYESRCRSCQQMIGRLMQDYNRYKEAGVRVITLSVDTDPALFEEYSEKFPWVDKWCDFGHYDSPNFIAYGVAGVPTTFLVDGKGKVVSQLGEPGEITHFLLDE